MSKLGSLSRQAKLEVSSCTFHKMLSSESPSSFFAAHLLGEGSRRWINRTFRREHLNFYVTFAIPHQVVDGDAFASLMTLVIHSDAWTDVVIKLVNNRSHIIATFIAARLEPVIFFRTFISLWHALLSSSST